MFCEGTVAAGEISGKDFFSAKAGILWVTRNPCFLTHPEMIFLEFIAFTIHETGGSTVA